MKRASMYGILMIALVSLVDIAHAQSKSSTAGRVEAKRGEIQSMRLLAQPRSQNRGVSLMTRSRNANANGSVLSFTPMTIGPSLQVLGGGTLGRLTKWTGLTSSNSFIGDSSIFEDKFGKVGIGTDSPSSTLTVAGMIEITLGGLKFPDGTVQTTSAAGALFSVAHDLTLQGNGTSGSPLGVAVPLALTGSSSPTELVRVLNTATSGAGVFGGGGPGGTGVKAAGGKSTGARGGGGVEATGGDSTVDGGGVGVSATGGDGNDFGGRGVLATGGNGIVPGPGVEAAGGVSTSGNGGNGVNALGGNGSGAGNSGGIGIVAQGGANGATFGLAGKFNGNVQVTGNLSKGGGAFKIDHPLDPENKYLYHSFVESPDMMNIYNGNITTDENGEATIPLPEWFEALNKDFRYQLTVIGTFAQAIVAEKIKGNRFRIRTSTPGVEVSWQVTGIRRDAYANAHRIPVEEDKTDRERGFYLHPDAYSQPEERGMEWARYPEMMQRIKQQRTEAEQKMKHQQR